VGHGPDWAEQEKEKEERAGLVSGLGWTEVWVSIYLVLFSISNSNKV
jgi:hypothetical protein